MIKKEKIEKIEMIEIIQAEKELINETGMQLDTIGWFHIIFIYYTI